MNESLLNPSTTPVNTQVAYQSHPRSSADKPYKIITPNSSFPVPKIESVPFSNQERNSPHDLSYQPVPQPATYYLYSRINKPFTELHKRTAYVKGSSRLEPIPTKNQHHSASLIFSEKEATEENPLNHLKTKIDFTPLPLWGAAKHSHNVSMTSFQDDKSSMPSPMGGRGELHRSDTSPESRRYRSVGKRLQGFQSAMSTQRNSSYKRSARGLTPASNISFDGPFEQNRHAKIGLRSSVEKQPRKVVIESGVSKTVMDEFEEKHQSFAKSMKILENLAADVHVSHEHITSCIQKSEKRRKQGLPLEVKEEEIAQNANFREMIISELGEMLNKKLTSRKLDERLKKSDVEGFGTMITMYMKKIAEGLVNQGCSDSALMLLGINKLLAVEFEDIFASYVIQLDLIKKNSYLLEKDLQLELDKEKKKNKQASVMMKIRQAAWKEKMNEAQEKYERYLKESKEQKEKLRSKEILIESLLRQIRRGLIKPIPVRSTRKTVKKDGKLITKKMRRYSDDLDVLTSRESSIEKGN